MLTPASTQVWLVHSSGSCRLTSFGCWKQCKNGPCLPYTEIHPLLRNTHELPIHAPKGSRKENWLFPFLEKFLPLVELRTRGRYSKQEPPEYIKMRTSSNVTQHITSSFHEKPLCSGALGTEKVFAHKCASFQGANSREANRGEEQAEVLRKWRCQLSLFSWYTLWSWPPVCFKP